MSRRRPVPTPNVGGHHPQIPNTPGAPENGMVLAWDNAAKKFVWVAPGGGVTDHDALTPATLEWPSSAHTGTGAGDPSVAAFNPGTGAAEESVATADETMLVRRAGVLQWIPLLVAAASLPVVDPAVETVAISESVRVT